MGRVRLSIAVLSTILLSGPAQAATLPFTATLSVTVGSLPTANFTGSGVAQSNGFGQSFTLPANFLSGVVTFPPSLFTTPTVYKVTISLTGNAAGSFNPSFSPPNLHASHVSIPSSWAYGARVGGPMAVAGNAFVNIFSLFTLTVPLGKAGLGSTTTVVQGGIFVTVAATQWTTAYGLIFGISDTVHLPASMSVVKTVTYVYGGDARTAGGAGQIFLVTPIKALTNVAGNLAVLTSLTINFIPEPGSLLLLGAGLLGLAALRRRRA